MTKRNPPKWVVLYSIITAESPWIGNGYEFFDDRETAERRYVDIPSDVPSKHYSGPVCGCLRPYHSEDERRIGGGGLMDVAEERARAGIADTYEQELESRLTGYLTCRSTLDEFKEWLSPAAWNEDDTFTVRVKMALAEFDTHQDAIRRREVLEDILTDLAGRSK